MTAQADQLLEIRPRRVRMVAGIAAVALIIVFTVVAILLRNTPTGVIFHTEDQIAMVGVGIALAAGVLSLTRPRLRADDDGVEVRNVLTTQRFPWGVVQGVSFPDGASWARLELPDDEYVSIMAIQAADKEYAIQSVRAMRALLKQHA